jgi:hypothetical protein
MAQNDANDDDFHFNLDDAENAAEEEELEHHGEIMAEADDFALPEEGEDHDPNVVQANEAPQEPQAELQTAIPTAPAAAGEANGQHQDDNATPATAGGYVGPANAGGGATPVQTGSSATPVSAGDPAINGGEADPAQAEGHAMPVETGSLASLQDAVPFSVEI